MSLELRKASDGTSTISGEASVGDAEYSMGSHAERVSAGAFTHTLRTNPDVLLTPEHDRSRAVARTGDGGNLELRESASGGLYYVATVDTANDSDARSLTSKIERRVYRESSFAFRVPRGGDEWSADYTLRMINRVDLHRGDVSVVPFGAYPTTSATVQRAAVGTLHERRALAERISSTGWFGPGLISGELRQGWANQHGCMCETCDGTGDCPDGDGAGWTGHDESSGRSDVRRDRARTGIKRSAHKLPSSRFEEFELELAVLKGGESRLARQHRGPTERDRAEQNWQRHREAQTREWLERRFGAWGFRERARGLGAGGRKAVARRWSEESRGLDRLGNRP